MTPAVEVVCLVLLLAYLLWLPLPFGSIIPSAFPPLILPPLLIGGVIAAVRSRQRRRFSWPASLLTMMGAGTLILVLVALQLLPLPRPVLQLLSPESGRIWERADRVATLAGVQEVPTRRPISVDPERTLREWFRLAALLATVAASAMLIIDRNRRFAFGMVLGFGALFQAVYGAREGALERYAIWGWRNVLIFNRVTGTFVNPNHFGHYIAIILPLVLFIGIAAWHRAGRRETPLSIRLATLMDRAAVRFGISIVVSIACVAGILLSQSRGTLLATTIGLSCLASFLAVDRLHLSAGTRKRVRRMVTSTAFVILTFAVLVGAVALSLGRERTIRRFSELRGNPFSMGGRSAHVATALRVWRLFPVTGSGAGTFERVVSIAQRQDLEAVYQHAHNDYVELLATCGIVGFAVVMAALVRCAALLVREIATDRVHSSWTTRCFIAACLSSLAIVAVHALYDFNFYMPSNAATAAAIAGAASALRVRDSSSQSAAGTALPNG